MNIRCTRGLTLIETVVWIAIFTSAMMALTTSVLVFYRTSNSAIQEATATASPIPIGGINKNRGSSVFFS